MLLILLAISFCCFSRALQLTAGQRIGPRNGRRIDDCRSLFNLPAVEAWAEMRGLREHHLKTLYKIVMTSSTDDNLEQRLIDNDFPRRDAADLTKEFQLCTSHVIETHPSQSGGKKLVIQLENGKKIETVIIRHETTRGVRYTVCVSSQVGCARACSFCATGTMGLLENLPSALILEQVFLAASTLAPNPVRNVVFMGQGEPMDNWNSVHEALRGLTHQCLFGLAAKQVTVSTVGASPHHIRLLANDAPQISLALSLHGATQELRQRLMPQTALLEDIEAALDYHSEKTGQSIMMEYLLIDGVNDSSEAADALVRFCQARLQMPFVNLIPYNPTIAGVANGYNTPSDDQINRFHNSLLKKGIRSIVRWSSATGRGIGGACGQLVVEQ